MRRFRQPQTGGGAGDIGDANAWDRSGATYYDQIAAGLAVASAGDVVLAGDGQAYRVIDDGGTLRAVRPEVYDGTSPTIHSRIDGDETDDAALAANGWTISKPGTGYTSYSGTAVTMGWTNGGTTNRDGVTIRSGLTLSASAGMYWSGLVTVNNSSTGYQYGMQAFDGSVMIRPARNWTYNSGGWSMHAAGDNLSVQNTTAESFVEFLCMPDRGARLWVDGEIVTLGALTTASGSNFVDWVAYDSAQAVAGSGSMDTRNFALWSFT